jgi:PIN domain nuclease of toxin-antitoxin system
MPSAVIVIPSYNEAQRLQVHRFQEFVGTGCPHRLLFVNDGSTDGTLQVPKVLRDDIPQLYDIYDLPTSYWEIAIKIRLGRYTLNVPSELFMQRGIGGNGFAILPIEPKHIAALLLRPLYHRDPFDRLLIARATVEQIPIVSSDSSFDAYPVTRR